MTGRKMPDTTGQRAVNAPRLSRNEPTVPKGQPGAQKTVNQVSIDLYNAMYAAWCERQTVSHVRKRCQVNQKTAEKYIEHGDPPRKIPAIRTRWERTMQNAQMAEDYSIVKARREVQTAARVYLARLATAIAALDPTALDPNKLVGQLQCTQAVLERTLGVADATVQIQGNDRFANWTSEELLEFARTGTMPDHAIGDGSVARTRQTGKE
jgi:hypothetical protein